MFDIKDKVARRDVETLGKDLISLQKSLSMLRERLTNDGYVEYKGCLFDESGILKTTEYVPKLGEKFLLLLDYLKLESGSSGIVKKEKPFERDLEQIEYKKHYKISLKGFCPKGVDIRKIKIEKYRLNPIVSENGDFTKPPIGKVENITLPLRSIEFDLILIENINMRNKEIGGLFFRRSDEDYDLMAICINNKFKPLKGERSLK